MIRATLRWIFCLAILATPALSAEGWTAIDADTLRSPSGVTVRVANIDAPELAPKCRCSYECAAAERARSYVSLALAAAGAVTTRRYSRPVDRYGRTLAYVLIDGRDLGELLIAQGLARPWRGRREKWCP